LKTTLKIEANLKKEKTMQPRFYVSFRPGGEVARSNGLGYDRRPHTFVVMDRSAYLDNFPSTTITVVAEAYTQPMADHIARLLNEFPPA
jgi:hypothetical protein